ncbi:hypothetical protein GQS_03635 [Thermococcus sp. 4557]|uniref:hypothetical protein n=1 Tax=Thermococcus sp. (strain CGMCC 1.5172 / 4557) TaxID=1042877 RepID=UPI000219E860|nr:hypothetical protein [Thermococcus sp. 4557]AEK72628.1 hypothetical protein GQS_03635 [Thermococcus sp. 4557]
MSELAKLFENEAVRNFGRVLRNMIRPPIDNKTKKEKWSPDYSSLVELEYVEKSEDFVDVIKRLLRRYETIARKHNLRRVSEKDLEELVKLVDEYGVKLVRSALISYALVKGGEENE